MSGRIRTRRTQCYHCRRQQGLLARSGFPAGWQVVHSMGRRYDYANMAGGTLNVRLVRMCNYGGCNNTWLCVCDVQTANSLLLIEAVSLNQVQQAVVASLHDTVMHGLPIVARHRRGYSASGHPVHALAHYTHNIR